MDSSIADARTEAKFDGLQVPPVLRSVICDCSTKEMPVQAEGCDCVNEIKGVGVYRLAPDDEEGPQCILVADNDYYGVLGPSLEERTAAA